MNVYYTYGKSVTKMQLCIRRSRMHRTHNTALTTDYTILLVSIWICCGQVCGYSCSTILRHNQNLHNTNISHVTPGK